MFVSTTVVSTRSRRPRTTRRSPATATRRSRSRLRVGPSSTLGEPDQRLGVGDPFALDAAEGAVDEVGPDLALALVKAPVEQVLEDEHPEDHHRGRPGAAALPAPPVASAQGLDHVVDQRVIREDLIHRPERGIPELVPVGQQDLDQATLGERASDHPASAETVGLWVERAATPRAAGDSPRRAPAVGPGAPARRPRRLGPAGPGPAGRSSPPWSRPIPGSSYRDEGRACARPDSGTRPGRRCGRSRTGCQRSPGGPGAEAGGAGRRGSFEGA